MVQTDHQATCPFCGALHPYGTLFCEQCGAGLSVGETSPVVSHTKHGDEGGSLRHPLGENSQPEKFSGRVQVQKILIEAKILNTGHAVRVLMDDVILLGRKDADRGILPELDLTMVDGQDLGVSRRHARILTYGGRCFIEDLDSMNGTYLKDERLTPHLLYRLKDGDILTLGTMHVQLNIHTGK
ncbi:MAG: FHA domain-containing protein [Anaerolineae bacterium]|nr:FHA domain-containing protein [Anaerolineae bacterium]